VKALGALMVWAGSAQDDHARGNGFVERRDVLAHHLGPEHRGGAIANEHKIASCDTCNRRRALSNRVPVVHGAAYSALHSKIASVVFGSSTEASARPRAG
jgi:hypothetical protein